MIYLDNSATGGFKPTCVMETAVNVIRYLSANPGRSAHRLSKTGAEFIYNARKRLSKFFNNGSVERVIFTKNCTEALNIALLGLNIKNTTVITSVTEHNSVLRPLYALRDKGVITLKIITPSNEKFITAIDVINAYDESVSLVVLNGASNVTGAVNDISGVGDFLREKSTIFMVDGAQTAGHIKIDMQKFGVDILAVAGHKGLYAISGSGALIFNNKVKIEPTFFGGTGTESFNPSQPDCYPEKLECGTLNLPAICSIDEGVRYVENNIDYVSEMLINNTEYLIDKLSRNDKVTVYSTKNPVGIVAFKVNGISSSEIAETLSSTYNIAVRGGFHCAPLMHTYLKTDEDGLVRASISPNNTRRELNALIVAINKITCF
ncbi:MAG: aminotransferase class V-fold PLP-dependent enzyme [Clostridia bacterium]|nr:aminotransferase class V-fold PLP-dependent enzyme [Clostridia bacterium]